MTATDTPAPAVIAEPAARTVHVERCMGTVFTIDVRGPGDWTAAIGDVLAWLHHVDDVFSTFKPASDISRIQRRALRLVEADPDVATVLDLCAGVQEQTAGAFTALAAGRIDPTGLVKGWAIERASEILRRYGSANHAVNGGGDMQLAGEAAPGQPWRVGIADPHRHGEILNVVTGCDLAIATSGVAERGAHIRNPFTGMPSTGLASATVVGPSATYADAYATAVFVTGIAGIQLIDSIPGYHALMVTDRGEHLVSPAGVPPW